MEKQNFYDKNVVGRYRVISITDKYSSASVIAVFCRLFSLISFFFFNLKGHEKGNRKKPKASEFCGNNDCLIKLSRGAALSKGTSPMFTYINTRQMRTHYINTSDGVGKKKNIFLSLLHEPYCDCFGMFETRPPKCKMSLALGKKENFVGKLYFSIYGGNPVGMKNGIVKEICE